MRIEGLNLDVVVESAEAGPTDAPHVCQLSLLAAASDFFRKIVSI